jgi:hypothetical protein
MALLLVIYSGKFYFILIHFFSFFASAHSSGRVGRSCREIALSSFHGALSRNRKLTVYSWMNKYNLPTRSMRVKHTGSQEIKKFGTQLTPHQTGANIYHLSVQQHCNGDEL